MQSLIYFLNGKRKTDIILASSNKTSCVNAWETPGKHSKETFNYLIINIPNRIKIAKRELNGNNDKKADGKKWTSHGKKSREIF